MQQILNESAIFGVKTNLAFLSQLLATDNFKRHQVFTNSLDNDEIGLSTQLIPEVIAIYAHHLLHPSMGAGAWQNNNGWRVQGNQALQLQFTFQGEEQQHQVSKECDNYLVNGQDHYLPLSSDLCHVHRNHVQIIHNNLRYEFTLADHEALASASNANAIYAPMPGKIIEVKVKTGDTVTLGQTLVVMEAMKMELELKAERDATIKSVDYKAADQVKADDVLVELESL